MVSVLETRFDVIILTEIGARNITTIQNIMHEYNFFLLFQKTTFMEEREPMYITIPLMYV